MPRRRQASIAQQKIRCGRSALKNANSFKNYSRTKSHTAFLIFSIQNYAGGIPVICLIVSIGTRLRCPPSNFCAAIALAKAVISSNDIACCLLIEMVHRCIACPKATTMLVDVGITQTLIYTATLEHKWLEMPVVWPPWLLRSMSAISRNAQLINHESCGGDAGTDVAAFQRVQMAVSIANGNQSPIDDARW
jgi:hypothetical protein